MTKIVICGGHYTPAKAVIDELLKNAGWQIYYIGRKYAMEDDRALALEFQELEKVPEVKYLIITAGRLQRKFFINVFQSIKALLKVFVGFFQSFFWLIKYRPKVILSFGGYIAVPVVVSGWLLQIPVITHEQTITSGLANKIIALFAQKILVSWPASVLKFPKEKVVLTGNPIRNEILEKTKNMQSMRSSQAAGLKKQKVLYVTGGNQGSHAINATIEEILPDLLKKYKIIHQTGDSGFNDYNRLANNQNPNYKVIKFLNSKEVADVLNNADLVISRSGANTVTELAALAIPAIFIPIVWGKDSEQLQNAKMLANNGAAEIILQKELTGQKLLETIDKMMENLQKYQAAAQKCNQLVKLDAAERIVQELK